MVPGALTLESAARTGTDDVTFDETTGAGSVLRHAAGVQLIYEGLRLTRGIAQDEPWVDAASDAGDSERADLEILAADILVARGFYLLARTDAADKAVRTVQNFGRDQTTRDDIVREGTADGDPAALDANLERDVLELAIRTGAASVDERPSPRLLSAADHLARDVAPSFPPAEDCLDELESLSPDVSLEDGTTDRATSATDP